MLWDLAKSLPRAEISCFRWPEMKDALSSRVGELSSRVLGRKVHTQPFSGKNWLYG